MQGRLNALFVGILALSCLGADGAVMVTKPFGLRRQLDTAFANFGPPPLTDRLAEGLLVIAEPANGCTAPVNAIEMSGAIVMMRRGGCSFTAKVIHAQRSGAIGVLIGNTNMPPGVQSPQGVGAELFTMSDDGNGYRVRIPSEMISVADAELLERAVVEFGQPVEIHMGRGMPGTHFAL